MDLDNEYRKFNDVFEHEAAKRAGVTPLDPYYGDIIHDALCDIFREKMAERFELLLSRPEERVQLLRGLVSRLESELEDYEVEKYPHAALETMLLLRMLKPELEAFERLLKK